MKISSIAAPVVLASLANKQFAFGETINPDAVAPRTLKKNEKRGMGSKSGNGTNKSGPYQYGYRLAYELWQSGNYDCTRDEVNNFFKPDVRDEVYDDCENTYWNWPNRERDCKKGADDFVLHKHSECSTATDCKDDFGDTAAREVASALCPVGNGSSKSSYSPPPRFDPECEEHARIRCYDEVVTLVEEWCANPDQYSWRYLKRQCDEKIEDLIN